MAILETLIKEHVKFDPLNAEHRQAYLMLMYKRVQHPTLRFILQVPHASVVHMMQTEMAALICKNEIEQMGIDISELPRDNFQGMTSPARPAEDHTPPKPVMAAENSVINLAPTYDPLPGFNDTAFGGFNSNTKPGMPNLRPFLHRSRFHHYPLCKGA